MTTPAIRMRAKIDERFNDKYIYTVRGVGYVTKD